MSFYFLHRNYFKENTYEKKYEILALAVTSFGTLSGVAAATQYPGGGVWTYGASNGGAFSNYYHGSKYHSSTVVRPMLMPVRLRMLLLKRLLASRLPFTITIIN